jgi:hypothetical protein
MLKSGKYYSDDNRRFIEETVKEHRPKAIYLPNLNAWNQWQRDENNVMSCSRNHGWLENKSGKSVQFEGSKVFVGPAWSVKIDDQMHHWELIKKWIEESWIELSKAEETSTSSPVKRRNDGHPQTTGARRDRHKKRRFE